MDKNNSKWITLYNDIVNKVLVGKDLIDFFNGYQCYISKSDFGELVVELFLNIENETLKEIINSRKGKLYDDYTDEYGDSFINLFIIKAVKHADKRKALNTLLELLEDDEVNLKWDIINNNHENTLHVVCLIANYLTKEELIRFMKIFKSHNFNPLNIDDLNRNAITIFKLDNKHSEEDSIEILKIMDEMVENFIVEVDNYIEPSNAQ